ncbi:MAG TPA: glycosyltransferase [Bacteroidia bacterium]
MLPVVSVYTIFMAVVIHWLGKDQKRMFVGKHYDKTNGNGVSVIIPFRNEVNNIQGIIDSIELQNNTNLNIEFVFVDDHSEDHTSEYIKEKTPTGYDVSVILSDGEGKKAALLTGIKNAKYEIVLTIDADCTFERDSIYCMYDEFVRYDLNLLCGPIRLSGNSDFEKSQAIESAVLVAISSVFLNHRKPATCNGANLMYKKSLFFELGAFDHKGWHASGDDDLLMQKFAQYNMKKVMYVLNSECMVTTKACPDLKSFMDQRLRWLSKRKAYIYSYNRYLHLLFLLKTLFLVLLPLELFLSFHQTFYLLCCILLSDLLLFMKLRDKFKLKFTPLFFIYQFYPVLLLFKLGRTSIIWKGREIR